MPADFYLAKYGDPLLQELMEDKAIDDAIRASIEDLEAAEAEDFEKGRIASLRDTQPCNGESSKSL